MKIAVYHNLEKGGALNQLYNLVNNLNDTNTIDLYCHQKNLPGNIFNKTQVYKLEKTSNLYEHLHQVLFELKRTNQIIASDINKENYDLVLVFQCNLTQSPYLLKYLNKTTKTIYFWNEPKREFYEKTSFDHYSLKRTIARIIRLPIKYIDLYNYKHAKLTITCSSYASKKLLKIYGKDSVFIHPGLRPIKPKKITIKNNKNFVTIGPFSKIKGHAFSLNQLKGLAREITIIGQRTDEYPVIKELATKNHIVINKITTNNDQKKISELKKHTFYLANNENEPFGIATLEAADSNLFVLGKDQGGTREIIQNGLNGFLYPDNPKIARLAIKKLIKLKYISFYKTCKIDWKYYTNKIIKTYKEYYA